MSVLQTVQKKKKKDNLHMDRQCKKKQQTIYIWTDSAKKTTNNLHMDRQCKKKQQQFTYGQYIFTDCTEDNVQNTHTYTQYTYGAFPLHGTVRFGTARYGTVRLSSGRLHFHRSLVPL